MELLELYDLTGNTANINGGGNGIGKATHLMLVNAGATVAVCDLDHGDAPKMAVQINSTGKKALGVTCHFTKDEDLVNLVDFTVKEPGGVHILLNNAGVGGGGRENPFKILVEDFAWRFQPNVFSARRLSQLCVPHYWRRSTNF